MTYEQELLKDFSERIEQQIQISTLSTTSAERLTNEEPPA